MSKKERKKKKKKTKTKERERERKRKISSFKYTSNWVKVYSFIWHGIIVSAPIASIRVF